MDDQDCRRPQCQSQIPDYCRRICRQAICEFAFSPKGYPVVERGILFVLLSVFAPSTTVQANEVLQIPDYPSMEKFKGIMHHSSFWPAEGVNANGKRVAVIGTGASGVQIIQEWGPSVEHLTVFQRTPNLALPMGERDLTKAEQEALYPAYDELLRMREQNFAGFTYDFVERNTFEDSPEERKAIYERLWKKAGFSLWLGSYKDYLYNMKANRCVYDFWRKKQMGRVKNLEKRAILLPEEPPHPFGVKRPCLEQNYYEVLDRDNVEIVDINEKSGDRSKSLPKQASRQATASIANSTSSP